MLDADKRERLRQAKAEVAELMKPQREAAKIARAKARKSRRAAMAERPMKGQREPRVRDNAYLAFLRRQSCLVCGKTPSDAAHVRFAPYGSGWRYVGKGEKPDDARAVPLCREHHEQQHSMNEARFWAEVLQRDPFHTCMVLYAVFMAQSPKASQHSADTREARLAAGKQATEHNTSYSRPTPRTEP